jgi:hypothetical protein
MPLTIISTRMIRNWVRRPVAADSGIASLAVERKQSGVC